MVTLKYNNGTIVMAFEEETQYTAVKAAITAITKQTNNELEIIDNETGTILFHYVHSTVKWMDGDFAQRLVNSANVI